MQQGFATNEASEPRQRSRRDSASSEIAQARRGGAPLLRVRCRCTTEQEFVQRYAADVCADGMFLRTQQALPAGARIRFELLLQNGRCALGGVGRVAWVREADCEQQRPGGTGIVFERLRRGDRAVIERMDAVRGDVPSRFVQPDALSLVPPSGADLARTLFADLGLRSGVESGASAFLSADLSQELGAGGWQLGRRANGAEHPIADLAEQLEPSSERELAADDDPEVDVELVAPRVDEPAAAHSTVRPSPVNPARSSSTPGAVHSSSAVYAVSADSAVSLALARSAVKAATRSDSAPARPGGAARPANALPAASLRARVDRVSKPKTLVAPAPIRRPPVAPAVAARAATAPAVTARATAPAVTAPAAAAPVAAAKPPTAVPAAASMPSVSTTTRVPARRRASTVPVAVALTAIIVLAIAVTYLSLTERLPHVLHAIGL